MSGSFSNQFQKSGSNSNQMNYASSDYGNQAVQNQNVFGPQQAALGGLYGTAAQTFQNYLPALQQLLPQAQRFMNRTANNALDTTQGQAAGGAYSDINASDVYKTLTNAMGKPSNSASIYAQVMGGQGNNYADAMKNQYVSDANRAQENMLSKLDARAEASGMSGSSRHGVATGLGMRDINSNLQRNLAETGFNTFDKDLSNKLNIAQQADQSNLSRQQMLVDMLAGKQGAMAGAQNYYTPIQDMASGALSTVQLPWTGLQNYANAIGAPTILNNGWSSGWGTDRAIGKGASTSSGLGVGMSGSGGFGGKGSSNGGTHGGTF